MSDSLLKRFASGAALAAGVGALLAQLAGLVVAVMTPYDTQGAVGKAFAAIFTQFGAMPLALIGISASVVARILCRRFDGGSLWGFVCALGGLVPLSLIYVAVVR